MSAEPVRPVHDALGHVPERYRAMLKAFACLTARELPIVFFIPALPGIASGIRRGLPGRRRAVRR
jgi:hypothetical protein